MPDVRPPFLNADERATLLAALDYLRESVVRKAEGIDDTTLRRPMVASGTSLLGLIKHLTMAEAVWFPIRFAGREVVAPASELEDGDTVESVVADYRSACVVSNEIIDACAGLDERSVHPASGGDRMSMRWILVHMVEETARHAGHADILREQIDGSTGR